MELLLIIFNFIAQMQQAEVKRFDLQFLNKQHNDIR